MKIAIDIRPIGQQRTGDEVYTLNLVQNLINIDSENFYFLLTNTDNEEDLVKIKTKIFGKNSEIPNNVKIISIKPASKFLWTFFLLPIWIKKNKIDVLHVQYITPIFLSKNTKLITTIHDVSFDAYPEFIKKSDLFFLKTLIPLSLRKADKIIAVSNFTKNEIVKYYQISLDKINTIYNGNAPRAFSQESTEQKIDEVIKKYGIKKSFIFHIGTLQPRKNIPFLLRSYQFFQKKYSKENSSISEVRLCLTGDLGRHNFDEKIEITLTEIKNETPEIYEKIKFLGYIEEDELPILFQSAECIILTSLYEGFGLPAIEAMTAKTPLISNDESCLKEVIEGSAVFYQQGSQESLAKRIFEVIINKDLQNEMIQKGLIRADYFNWKKCAQETLNLYKSLKR